MYTQSGGGYWEEEGFQKEEREWCAREGEGWIWSKYTACVYKIIKNKATFQNQYVLTVDDLCSNP